MQHVAASLHLRGRNQTRHIPTGRVEVGRQGAEGDKIIFKNLSADFPAVWLYRFHNRILTEQKDAEFFSWPGAYWTEPVKDNGREMPRNS